MKYEEKHSGSGCGGGAVHRKKIMFRVVLGCLVFLAAAYVCFSLLIGSHVRSVCVEAMQEYPGDRIEAVIAYVDSERHSLKERNKAVWALGYLGDERAVPVLKKHLTGGACDHDRYLCQGELGKAIKLCEGGLNPFAWACW